MHRVPAVLLLCAVLGGARAAALDVPAPYVPSTRTNVDEMLRLAAVTPRDVVYGLGSGRVRDDVMEGVVRSGTGPRLAEHRWRAVRVGEQAG